MDPKGKVALITGGGVRVGRAISLGLAEAGADLVVHYNRSASPAEETIAEARRLGVEAVAVRADLGNPESARTIVQAAQRQFGKVDILVHAASPFVRTGLFDVTLETWRQIQGVLVESFLLLLQELTPGMIEHGKGVIVAILDRGVFDPWPKYLAHGVGKSALWALACSAAVELAPQVRVNGVVPGPVLPPPSFTEEQVAQGAQATLLGRWGSPQDVVHAVLYLVQSEYTTGEVLFVDGGERWAHRFPGES
ncbi:MAG: SDR family oxidoreductase [Anaerolineae bacterium]|jgi:NAD(P)-dependent dehydrogenase (short-subunit alcohol dehydrogenase family)